MTIRRVFLLLAAAVGVHCAASGQSVRSDVVLSIDERNYYIHTTQQGESVGSIAAAYLLDEGEVRQENHLTQNDTLTVGRILRVPCYDRVSRLAPRRGDDRFERIKPADGQTLFEVAMDNAISLDTLIVDNPGVDLTNISGRSTINIRKSATRTTQLPDNALASRRYAELLGALSRRYDYFVVESGGTLYSLAAANNVSVDELLTCNGNPLMIYVGMALKAPRRQAHTPMEYFAIAEQEEIVGADSTRLALATFNDEELTVSMVLPLTARGGKVRGNFVDFYQGALLAAEDLKAEGRNINLQLYDIAHNPQAISDLLANDEAFGQNTDLFIGPIYEDDIAPLAGIDRPVVLPLTSRLDSIRGRNLYRMVPTDSARIDKLDGLITPTTNVIMVQTATTDSVMVREALDLLGNHPYGKAIFDKDFVIDSLNSRPIEELMAEEDNLFMVLSTNEIETDRSLAIISSMMNSRQPKYGTRRVPIWVIGRADWAKYRNMDRNLLFKLDVSYLVPYHADRGDKRVKEFDRRFIEAFGRQPSMFAYRAYDAMKLFGDAMFEGGDLTAALNGSVTPLLQVPYSFTEENGIMVNDTWPLVNYRPNYTIEVK